MAKLSVSTTRSRERTKLPWPTREEMMRWPEDVRIEYRVRRKGIHEADYVKSKRHEEEDHLLRWVAGVREMVASGSPLTVHEVQQAVVEALQEELAGAQRVLDGNQEEAKRLRARIKEIKKLMPAERRKAAPERARIYTLPEKWRTHWLRTYEDLRDSGRSKQHAAALAWSAIKVHCVKDDEGVWNCPEFEDVYYRSGHKFKEQKDRSKSSKQRKHEAEQKKTAQRIRAREAAADKKAKKKAP